MYDVQWQVIVAAAGCRGLSEKDRGWIAALADKLVPVVS
jgi:hypothetical protein